ncbi:MAG TPA: AsmA-like C-terminal region-containing protein [Bacteroidales bacterium]|nr:AsmA-like C-terminal region-containing protein [Bacteroidales bacterium]
MKLLINILKWTIVTTGAIILALLTLSFIMSDRVAGILLSSLNKEIATRVEIGGYRLSLLRKFPRASVELHDLVVLSSGGFDKKQFTGINTDTLLTAKSVSLEFGMGNILNGTYNIQSITVSGGRLNLFSDSSGRVNYEVTASKSNERQSADTTSVNLDKIVVSGLRIRYINKATSLDISGAVINGKFKSRLSGKEIDLQCNTAFRIGDIGLFSVPVRANASGSLDLNLHRSDSGTVFRKSILKLEDFRFGLSGKISSRGILDLSITGQNIHLEKVKKYLPAGIAGAVSEYSPEGIFKTECRIGGQASRKESPSIDLSFSLDDGSILYRKSDISIRDLSISGSFSNGSLRRPETFSLDIKNYSFKIGSAGWSGNVIISDFTRPSVRAVFSGDIIPAELISFLKIPQVTRAEGSARLNMSVEGTLGKKDKYQLSDFLAMNPQADIRFRSFSLKCREKNYSLEDVDGDIMVARNLWADDLSFTWLGQRLRVNGELTGLPARLSGENVIVRASADVTADYLSPPLFLPDSSSAPGKGNMFKLPENLEANISFRINRLEWNLFDAGNISGRLFYTPRRIDLRSLSVNALDGTAGGDCFLTRDNKQGYITHGSFTFENIDINKTFRSFKNFGQTFIVSDNLAGSLTGNLNILMPLDSMLNPVAEGVTAEGKYVLLNGALINFEPVRALSDYIELSELQNITFSRLENEIFIRDKYVAIPQMDIKSSAADFTVSGKHRFDDSYEYHVRTCLSLILSKKARKGKNSRDEFGAVEDDGLGRTSIFLKITGVDDKLKVAYDLKAAGNNVKQNLKKEKENLKTILNQEYGWFRRDSSAKKENESRPKFRIVFPETDSSGTRKDTVQTGSNKRINRIFKRKLSQDPS